MKRYLKFFLIGLLIGIGAFVAWVALTVLFLSRAG